MRTLVVGDVHGCARELRKLVEKVEPTRVILVGDLFSRGPKPVKVWELVQHYKMEAVLGNGDRKTIALRQGANPLPREAVVWLQGLPLSIKGKVGERKWGVIHAGVNPERGLKGTTRRQAIGIARWPTDKLGNPMWWELYTKDRLIVHGHHARFGLVDRRPYSLGLDTGCVHGRRLTGYLIEEDALVSVKSKVLSRVAV